MKIQRNISSAFIFISAFIAVVYSAAHFSEDEVMNQIREDLLLAKLFNRMQAREQGMDRSILLPPYSSPLFNPFLSGRGNTGKASQQKKPSTAMLPKVRGFLNMDRAKGSTFVSPREARLQEKALPQFFSRLLDPIQDARAMKYQHASKQHKESTATNRVKMATTVEGRVQDYIRTLSQTKINEQAQKLIANLFSCSIGSLPDFVESLKGSKIFGIPTSRILEGFKQLTERSSSGLSFYQNFVNFVFSILNPKSLVAKEQVFNFDLLRDIFKGAFPRFADVPHQKGENETFRNILNIASTFVIVSTRKLTAEEETRFNNSINFFVERYGFKQIDRMEKSEEEKTAMKKALRGAVNTVVAAIFKIRNGKRLNSDNRTSLLRSIITVLVSLNNRVSDTPLLQFIDQFLARNPTNQELSTKSQCLLVLFFRKALEFVVGVLKSDRKSVEEVGPASCAVDFMADGFRVILEYIPVQISNVGGCEDFAMIGYRGVAQEVKRLRMSTLFDSLGINN